MKRWISLLLAIFFSFAFAGKSLAQSSKNNHGKSPTKKLPSVPIPSPLTKNSQKKKLKRHHLFLGHFFLKKNHRLLLGHFFLKSTVASMISLSVRQYLRQHPDPYLRAHLLLMESLLFRHDVAPKSLCRPELQKASALTSLICRSLKSGKLLFLQRDEIPYSLLLAWEKVLLNIHRRHPTQVTPVMELILLYQLWNWHDEYSFRLLKIKRLLSSLEKFHHRDPWVAFYSFFARLQRRGFRLDKLLFTQLQILEKKYPNFLELKLVEFFYKNDALSTRQRNARLQALSFLFKLRPHMTPWHFWSALLVKWKLKRYDAIRHALQKELLQNPIYNIDPNIRYFALNIVKVIAKGQLPKFVSLFQKFHQKWPKDFLATHLYAQALAKVGKKEKAFNIYFPLTFSKLSRNKLIKITSFMVWTLKRPLGALFFVERYLGYHPHSYWPIVEKGHLLAKVKRFDAAKKTYDRAYRLRPSRLLLSKIYSLFVWKMNQPKGALTYFSDYLKRKKPPHWQWVLFKRALIYKKLRLYDKAEKDFQTILRSSLLPAVYVFNDVSNFYQYIRNDKKRALQILLLGIRLQPRSSSLYSSLGSLYRLMGQEEKSALAYFRAYRLQHRSYWSFKYYLDFLKKRKQFKKALRIVENEFKQADNLLQRRFLVKQLFDLLLRVKGPRAALALIKSFNGRHAHFVKGQLYARIRMYPQAIREYSLFIKNEKRNSFMREKAFLARAKVYEKIGQLQLALDDYKQYIKLRPDFYYNYLPIVFFCRWKLRRPRLAIHFLSQFIKRHPKKYVARIKRASLYVAIKDYPAAAFDYVLAMPSLQSPWLFYSVARFYYYRYRRPKLALAVWDYCMAKFPKEPKCYTYKGDFLIRMRRYNLAAQNYRKAIRLKHDIYSYRKLASLYSYYEKNPRKALQVWNQFIRHYPNEASAYYSRSKIYQSMKRYLLVVRDLKKALKLKSNYYLYARSLAEIYDSYLHRYDLAIDVLTNFLKNNPSSPLIYEQRAKIYMKLKMWSLAIADLKMMYKRSSYRWTRYNALKLLGGLFLKLKQPKKALIYYQKALRETKYRSYKKILLRKIYSLYLDLGNYQKSLIYYNLYLKHKYKIYPAELLVKNRLLLLASYSLEIPYQDARYLCLVKKRFPRRYRLIACQYMQLLKETIPLTKLPFLP